MPTKRKLAILLIKDKQIIISHSYLINIHIFDYPDSRLSGLFTEVPMSPDNRGSTVVNSTYFTDWRYETFTERYSFGNVLAQYELWVQNVSDITPRIKCKDQQVFMSDYQFESDKMNVPQTQGDGGYLEEVWTTWEDHSRVRCTGCINVLSIWDTDSLFQGVFYGHVKF